MNKIAVLVSAATLALAGSSLALAAGPGGFGPGPGHHRGPGYGCPNTATVTVAQLQQGFRDDARVSLQGKLTKFYGHDRYEFADKTGTMVVELDDDRDWSHISRDQNIVICGKTDYDDGLIIVEVKRAFPVK